MATGQARPEENVAATQKVVSAPAHLPSHTQPVLKFNEKQVEKTQQMTAQAQAGPELTKEKPSEAEHIPESQESDIATQETVMDTSTPTQTNKALVEEDEEIKKLREDTAILLDNVLEK